jgi:predicted DCC family thiol-disulfide oxidoreductase YuxK
MVRLVGALDRHRRVTAVPFQKPGFPEAHGLTVAECERSAWAITPDGAAYRTAAAVGLTGAVALGTPLPLWLYCVPGIRALQEAIYLWVARNRGRFPGDTPYCAQHPEECGAPRAEARRQRIEGLNNTGAPVS